MTQTLNQLGQAAFQGLIDLLTAPNTVAVQVDVSQATPLVPGQAVKMVDSVGGVPKVVAVAADTDDVMGFVNYSWKQSAFAAGQAMEISLNHNVMYMTASGAIARGASVMVVVSGSKVATATTGKTVAGRAYDKAVANGDLIRVWVTSFNAQKIIAP